jgi:acyl-CoA thioester hydrolase
MSLPPSTPPSPLSAYRYRMPITTRWADNDQYGHVNNVVYFAYFDTVVNVWLIENRLIDVQAGSVIGLVVENTCRYFKSLAFPDSVVAALAVERVGTSSVVYQIGLFREQDDAPAAQGRFVHVYVDRASQRPVPLPASLRVALDGLRLADAVA